MRIGYRDITVGVYMYISERIANIIQEYDILQSLNLFDTSVDL